MDLFSSILWGEYTTDSNHFQKLSTKLNILCRFLQLCLSIGRKQLTTELLNQVKNKNSRLHELCINKKYISLTSA